MREHVKYPTLLVVTDNPSIRFWIKKHFDDLFFVLDASKKEKALEIVQTSPLDFIILDSTFEEFDPLDLCKQIRKGAPNISTPIFLITGRLSKSFREKAISAGITDFLTDQLDANELTLRIEAGRKASHLRERTSSLFSQTKIAKEAPPSDYLKNKILLPDQALRILANEKKENRESALLILKIDQFSQFETSLKEEIAPLFSKFLSRCIGEKDLVIPSNEGQFLLLLTDTQIEQAQKLAETVRKELDRYRFQTKQGPIHLTASIAFTKVEGTEQSFQEITSAASEAFKKGKASSNFIISLDMGHS